MSGRIRHCYEFGPFTLNVTERLLLRDGQVVSLTPKVFELLLILVRNEGRTVERRELTNAIWPNVFVEEANLTQNIFALRKALGEPHSDHNYVQTVAKRGYRFTASIKEIVRESCLETQRVTYVTDRISLAVLPFTNLSSDPGTDYLCEGIVESIINNLSQLERLEVTAHNSVLRYKRAHADIQQVGRDLSVQAVLVGRMLSLDNHLIIKAELINAANDRQLWGGQYRKHSTDLIGLQEEIARDITSKLEVRLSNAERGLIAKRYTRNSEAYHSYLKGRFFWNKYNRTGIEKSIKYFQQAIQQDPTYALAYAGLADAHHRSSNIYEVPTEALSKARVAAVRAVEIDDLLPEAHLSLGLMKLYYDRDWTGAEREYKRAIALSSGAPLAYKRLGEVLMFTKRFDEALENYHRALELDPLSLQVNLNLGTCLWLMCRHDEAIAQLQKLIELDENYTPAYLALGCTHLSEGNFPESLREFKRAWQLDPEAFLVLGFLGHAYGISGNRRAALKVLKELEVTGEKKYVSPYAIAITHLGLGNKEEAFEWLEKTFEDNNDFLVWLNVGPELDSLRSDPRFVDLLQRVGFPQ
jgi:adenylate cyclase